MRPSAALSSLLEPINCVETLGYLLSDVDTALDLARRVGRANLRVLVDVNHDALNGGDPTDSFLAAGSWLGHVQLSDAPGRHEHGTRQL